MYALVRATRPSDLESQLFAPDTENSVRGGEVQALPSQVLQARPSQVGGPHAAIDLVKNPPGVSDSHYWPKGPPRDPRDSLPE